MQRYMKPIIVTLSVFIISSPFIAVWLISGLIIRPDGINAPRSPEQGLLPSGEPFVQELWQGIDTNPMAEFGFEYEEVEFPASDGSVLRGWFVPGINTPKAGIVTVHGSGTDRREFLRHLPIFYNAGYAVLLFDQREHGISDGFGLGVSYGVREHLDVSSAVEYMKKNRRISRVAVIGTSQGGASVLIAAARDPNIDAVISENPYTSVSGFLRGASTDQGALPEFLIKPVTTTVLWRLGGLDLPSPLESVSKIAPRPVFLMHGSSDELIPVSESELIYANSQDPAELWIVNGATHAGLINHAPTEYKERVVRFLQRWL